MEIINTFPSIYTVSGEIIRTSSTFQHFFINLKTIVYTGLRFTQGEKYVIWNINYNFQNKILFLSFNKQKLEIRLSQNYSYSCKNVNIIIKLITGSMTFHLDNLQQPFPKVYSEIRRSFRWDVVPLLNGVTFQLPEVLWSSFIDPYFQSSP